MSVKVKICGLRSRAEVEAAAAAGASYVGMVFYPPSPRHLTLADARWVAGGVPAGVARVALTVNADDDELERLIEAVPVEMLQLHGREPPERVAAVRARFGLPVMKAIGVAVRADLAQIDAYARVADQLLIDARPAPGADRPGGNGLAFDWRLLEGLRWPLPWMLAGGLTADNVAAAVELTGAAQVDVSSGVERAPGYKDPERVRAFVAAALAAAAPEAALQLTSTLASREARRRDSREEPMTQHQPNTFRAGPDERGRFGDFGGRFVSETLMPLILELEAEYEKAKTDADFWAEMDFLWKHYVGRPSPLYFAERLTERLGGAKVYFKRDELNHTGAHKINNVLGQILLARRMGKTRIIAETGAGQHGVATATACARFGLKCVVFMGATDVERQKPNVFRMKLLGAEVVPVTSGRGTLKDAMNEALRDWVTNVRDTFYCIGTVAGPHPYPAMVRDFQSIIGKETRAQMQEAEGRLPDSLVACIGGGSNAMGLFHPFLDDPGGADHRRRGRRPRRRRAHGACREPDRRPARGAARQPHLPAAGRRRPDHRGPLDLRRARLSGHRPGACLAARRRPGRVRQRHRRRGARGVPARLRDRGNHPGARAGACPRPRGEDRARAAARSPAGDESLRPRRQGHLYGSGRARSRPLTSMTKV